MFALGRVHIESQRVGSLPQLALEAQIGPIVGLTHFSPPDSLSFLWRTIFLPNINNLKARQAEDIIAGGKADIVALARGMMFDPRWAWHAAEELGVETEYSKMYAR